MEQARDGDTPGVLYGCENKGVVGEGVCKIMKIKGKWRVTRSSAEIPTPGAIRMVIKTKELPAKSPAGRREKQFVRI